MACVGEFPVLHLHPGCAEADTSRRDCATGTTSSWAPWMTRKGAVRASIQESGDTSRKPSGTCRAFRPGGPRPRPGRADSCTPPGPRRRPGRRRTPRGWGRPPAAGGVAGIACPEQRRQLAARRPAVGADATRVDPVLGGVGAHPAHGALDVVELGRPAVAPGGEVDEAVVGGESDVAGSRESRPGSAMSAREPVHMPPPWTRTTAGRGTARAGGRKTSSSSGSSSAVP